LKPGVIVAPAGMGLETGELVTFAAAVFPSGVGLEVDAADRPVAV